MSVDIRISLKTWPSQYHLPRSSTLRSAGVPSSTLNTIRKDKTSSFLIPRAGIPFVDDFHRRVRCPLKWGCLCLNSIGMKSVQKRKRLQAVSFSRITYLNSKPGVMPAPLRNQEAGKAEDAGFAGWRSQECYSYSAPGWKSALPTPPHSNPYNSILLLLGSASEWPQAFL